MDWTEIITAGIAALGAVGGSALMQSKATAVLQVKLDALRNDVDTLSTTIVSLMIQCKNHAPQKSGA